MDKEFLIAENLLRRASMDADGYLYPNQIDISKYELQKAFHLLAPFGNECIRDPQSPTPIFKINDMGRLFLAMGAWSEREKQETTAKRRHMEILELSRKNNKYVKLGILVATIIGIVSIAIQILIN